jgi:glutamine amidotransferase
VKEIEPSVPALKIPQIGWNTIELSREHPLFQGIRTGTEGLHAYFVHSYHLDATRIGDVVATADYGGPITAAVARNNLAGTQFHPEKSQALGLALIGNFLRWKP